ncbi:zinc knuckle domain protein [Aspergillus lentulus]|nr:zinc knuckle domain protein [Aspergillus lentulus]
MVVHCTPTEDFDLEGNKKLRIDKLMEENNLSMLLGIWLNTLEAVEDLITNGLLVGQRYISSMEPYWIDQKRYHRY